jgi:2-dehydro-3-deoxyphosphogluconate aldolase/(4S)-4-hydroxy-2-oxoglutarate aldolase
MTGGTALEAVERCGVLPVVVLDRAEDAVPLAQALLRGGIDCAEITLRTPAGLPAIDSLRSLAGFTVGAGTVLTVAEVKACVAAGARFIVSPGFDAKVVQASLDAGVDAIPGVATASEIMAGVALGLTVLKCFPAEQLGGPGWIKAVCGPFPEVRFVPSGGVSAENAASYAGVGIAALGTSWVAPRGLVAEHKFDEIEERAREFRRVMGR